LKQSSNKYLRFSAVAFQMIFIIAGAALLGQYLDKEYGNSNTFTIISSLLGVFIGMYLVIKEALNMMKN